MIATLNVLRKKSGRKQKKKKTRKNLQPPPRVAIHPLVDPNTQMPSKKPPDLGRGLDHQTRRMQAAPIPLARRPKICTI